jgi:hypothetical protein
VDTVKFIEGYFLSSEKGVSLQFGASISWEERYIEIYFGIFAIGIGY